MRYHVLATDYDGTLAHHGRVDAATVEQLKRLIASGRRLVLVTGRELPELKEILPELDLFELVVAENGGLLYRPSTKEEKPLAEPPPERFIAALKAKNVAPMSVGRTIVATWEPFEKVVLDTIRDLGVELQVIFNKGAVMVLPAGVNKASGLKAALKEMGLSPHNAIGIGDAENDHALLRYCEMAVAVSNALPSLKETADVVTEADHGGGVSQLIERMLANDLADIDGILKRHYLPFGRAGEEEVMLPPYGRNVLICGPSASGKSAVATRIMESLIEQKYQFCVIDPDGSYSRFEGVMILGGDKAPPKEDEVLKLLDNPGANAVVDLSGVAATEQPAFFQNLLSRLLQLRARTGRPHWIVLDEAHHLLPVDSKLPASFPAGTFQNLLSITAHPELLSTAFKETVTTVLSVGAHASETLAGVASSINAIVPGLEPVTIEPGELLLWDRDRPAPIPATRLRAHPSRVERIRRRRKLAESELPPERSFYFRGPDHRLNLRAQNLALFLQIGDGVDADTWNYHLRRGDYSKWFRESVGDDDLATAAEHIELGPLITADETRALMRTAVQRDDVPPAPQPAPGTA
jgi:HAD superfamily hydrolase (TIGR01484 family)